MAIESLFGVNADLASFILRVTVGSLFMIHGYPKLGSQREAGRGFMKSTGMPANMIVFAGVVELFGGLALIPWAAHSNRRIAECTLDAFHDLVRIV